VTGAAGSHAVVAIGVYRCWQRLAQEPSEMSAAESPDELPWVWAAR
jgi:hypothetical protein